MNNQNRAEFIIIFRFSRKAFQRLYQYAALTSTSDFKKKELPNFIKNTSVISQKNSNKESKIIIRFENNQFRDLQRSDFDILFKSYSIDERISKKAAIY